ncbi:MAG: nitroreductase family protein [Alphaproteobacteria bacterium]|nr:nitroreductase family protein [Alphaproteobacteria bacterium]
MYDTPHYDALNDLLVSRRSVGLFRENTQIADQTLRDLAEAATRAPSAYNLQNWRFIAVRTPDAKARLQAAAYGQPQIGTASATFIMIGVETGYLDLADRLRPAQDAGIVPDAVAESWIDGAAQSHSQSSELRRDEAFRSVSLASMCLMLAAESRGLATGPMSGFDADAVRDAFDLAPGEIPVMLITVGVAENTAWPQKPRRPVEDVLSFA